MSWHRPLQNFSQRVKGLFDKVEDSQREDAQEILTPPPVPVKDSLKQDAAGLYLDFEGNSGTRGDSEESLPPMPPAAPPPVSAAPSIGGIPLGDGIAGLKKRERGSSGPKMGITENSVNDTAYEERNEMVANVYQRYAKYGETIASAILTKALIPQGMPLLLARLELRGAENDGRNHEQIAEFIDRFGVEEFCRRVGIRYDAEKVKREQQRFADKERRARQEVYCKAMAESGQKRGIKLDDSDIKPVRLGQNAPPPGAQDHLKRETDL